MLHTHMYKEHVLLVVAVFACASTTANAGDKPAIYVVNYPLKYFADRVGAVDVEVYFPAPADIDPAHWMPEAATVLKYQQADLVLLNGAGYARWTQQVSLLRSRLLDTSKAFKDQLITMTDTVTHQHGPQGDHEHTGFAFTTWLDPKLAIAHARAIKDALIKLEPHNKDIFEERFAVLQRDLIKLHEEIQTLVARNSKQPLLVSHPVYQYFTRRYQLNVQSLHWEPDQMPDDSQWREFEGMLKAHPAKWMLWEGQPADPIATKLKQLGVGCVVFSPCSNVPDQGDFLSVMQHNVQNLEQVFSK